MSEIVPPSNVIPPQLTSDPDSGTQKKDPPNPLEERINQLISATKSAESQVAEQKVENADLKSAIAELSAQVTQLATQGSAPAAKSSPSDPFSSPGTVDTGAPGDVNAMIQQAVTSALQPITQKLEASDARVVTQTKQQTVFQEVATQFPALRDTSSQEFQVFARIYNERPDLQALPDAPRVIAEMTRGILSDQRTEDRLQGIQKTRASTGPGLPGRPMEAPDIKKLEEAHAALVEKGTTKGWSDSELGDYLHFKTALKAVQTS